MTLAQVIHILQQIALTQPNIRTATDGSIYEFLNANPSVEYDVFHVSQTTHRIEEDVDFYGFNLFYVSRLDDTMENNRLTIQSVAKECLTNIVRTFCEEYAAIDELPILRFYPFTQRFNDECAGMYVQLEIGIPVDWVCEDDFGDIGEITPSGKVKLQVKTITIKENGTQVLYPSEGYDGFSKITIKTEVPPEYIPAKLYDLTATTNSTYTPAAGFEGFGKVVVDVPQGSSAVLGSLSVNEEGEFHRTYNAQEQGLDGYSSVTINVLNDCECEDCQPYYDDGYEDGVADQKAKLSSRNITKNGEYTNPDGWSAITVNVSGDCSSAYTQGYNDAKAELSGLTATTNGSYIGEYSAVTVNVSSGAPEETTIITYHPVSGTNRALIIDPRAKFYDVNGVQRSVISNLYDSTTNTGTITISGKIAKLDYYLFNCPNSGNTGTTDECALLESISLPNSITVIGEFVFGGCEYMTDFIFPENLEFIGMNAFVNCARLERIQLPESCKVVDTQAFHMAGRLTDTDHSTVLYCWPHTYYGPKAFSDTGIAEIYFPTTGAPESDLSYFPQIYYDANPDYSPTRHTYDTFNGTSTDLHMHIGNPRRTLPYYWQRSFPNYTYDNDLYDKNKH